LLVPLRKGANNKQALIAKRALIKVIGQYNRISAGDAPQANTHDKENKSSSDAGSITLIVYQQCVYTRFELERQHTPLPEKRSRLEWVPRNIKLIQPHTENL